MSDTDDIAGQPERCTLCGHALDGGETAAVEYLGYMVGGGNSARPIAWETTGYLAHIDCAMSIEVYEGLHNLLVDRAVAALREGLRRVAANKERVITADQAAQALRAGSMRRPTGPTRVGLAPGGSPPRARTGHSGVRILGGGDAGGDSPGARRFGNCDRR
jgi:hypothetical protein